jgi:hypothetical protein
MKDDKTLELSPKMMAAVSEMKALVRTYYPDATFSLSRSDEDLSIVHLTTVIDADDPDEVTDLVIDRMRELLVNDSLPLYVIPIRSPGRVASMLAAARASVSGAVPTSAVG